MLKTSNDQRKLLPNFEHLFATTAQAPGGVARLRELILTLAVQGKLMAQDASDEPASELLRKIRAEKDLLIAEGKIKKDKPLAEITEEEKPFELPVGWEWVRLGNICSYIQRGKGPAYADYSAHRVVSQKCVRWYGLDLSPARFITEDSLNKYEEFRFLCSGDLLWNSTGTGTIGRACLVPVENDQDNLVADSHVTVVRSIEVDQNFLWRWIQSPCVQREIEGAASGTTNQIELNTSTVINHLAPLPPLAEQSRIVARVEELMRLCDVLEEKGRLEHAQHQQLLQAMLDSLTQTTNAQELSRHWQRLAQHFDLLIDRPEAVDALEQTILQLAVRGLLVPQDPKESCVELKLTLENERKSLPENWRYPCLGDVAIIQLGGTPSRQIKNYWGGHIKWISSGEVANCRILDSEEKITDEGLANSNAKIYPKGTVLIAMIGQGKTRGQSAILEVDASTNQNVAGVLINKKYITSEYVFLWALSEYARTRANGRGGAQPALNGGIIRSLPFPLPPLAEQSRIVARVTELRALCQQLRDKLTQARTTQTQLAQAWVEQVAV